MTLIVSTCGTSLLTNLARHEGGDLHTLAIQYANTTDPHTIPEDVRNRLDALLTKAGDVLVNADREEQQRLSAEMNGLFLLEQEGSFRDPCLHWLVASDTWLGKGTAVCVQRALEKRGADVDVKTIQGLRTDSPDDFRNAVSLLARFCAREVKAFRDAKRKVIFNLTGGFKAVQGFMQALGMLYADDIVYVFERTAALLHIPRLPVDIDALQVVREHEQVFRRLAANLLVTPDQVEGMPETLYECTDDMIDLSVWGEALWEEARDALMQERLWPPVSKKLRFGPGFEKSVQAACRQQPDRLRIVNERLLDLARHLEDPEYNPSSLDFKQLRGTHGSWTHECDAWSDRDAKRLYGHFENGVFVLDALDKHL